MEQVQRVYYFIDPRWDECQRTKPEAYSTQKLPAGFKVEYDDVHLNEETGIYGCADLVSCVNPNERYLIELYENVERLCQSLGFSMLFGSSWDSESLEAFHKGQDDCSNKSSISDCPIGYSFKQTYFWERGFNERKDYIEEKKRNPSLTSDEYDSVIREAEKLFKENPNVQCDENPYQEGSESYAIWQCVISDCHNQLNDDWVTLGAPREVIEQGEDSRGYVTYLVSPANSVL